MIRSAFLLMILFMWQGLYAQVQKINTAVLVVGGSTGGIAAGLQSARMGVPTVIVEQTGWLGGMLTAAGVSCTDGNADLHSSIWEDFRQALYQHYHTKNLSTGWVSETCFEPHVGDSIFKVWAAREKMLQVQYHWYFEEVLKVNQRITGARFKNKQGAILEVSAAITIDATDLGDVFASAGAGYDLGTEDFEQSGEKIAPGRSSVIQDLTWAATLKGYGKDANKIIPMPEGYDATKYYCSTSDAPCNGKPYAANTQKVLDYGKLRVSKNQLPKYMLNWPAHGNDYYLNVIEMKPLEREIEYLKAKNETLGFIYFLQTTLHQKNIGLADDELDHGIAFMPYNREGRRVKGLVRFNIEHIQHPYSYQLYRTGISVGDYPVDHHHAKYPGKVPPIPFPAVPSFNIPLGALIPQNIDALIVCEKGISVSNIANGTTRLQPVVLLTGQAAGVLAGQAIKTKISPANINVRQIQMILLQNKCYLMPFTDVLIEDPAWEAGQMAGLEGLIKGVGKSQGWANKTYFYPDSLMLQTELLQGIKQILPTAHCSLPATETFISLSSLEKLVEQIKKVAPQLVKAANSLTSIPIQYNKFSLPVKHPTAALNRKETAIYLQILFNFFEGRQVNIQGAFK